MRKIARILMTVAAAIVGGTSVEAQSRPIYITQGNGGGPRYIIQNGVLTTTMPGVGCDWSIAVVSEIRTGGCAPGSAGRRYTLTGTFLGPTATLSSGGGNDGTSDGTYNYTVTGTNVFRYNLDWSGGTNIFSISQNAFGITYDGNHNSIWVGSYLGGGAKGLFEYSMTGTFLSSFFPTLSGSGLAIGALAYDAVDNSLWFSEFAGNGLLYQYTESGQFLSSVNVPGTLGYFTGGEFQYMEETSFAPEPGSIVLTLTGLAGILGFARRKQAA